MRPDLKRIRSELAAQQQSVSVAKASFGPRGEGVGGRGGGKPTIGGRGGGEKWVGGNGGPVGPFGGGTQGGRVFPGRGKAGEGGSGEGNRHGADRVGGGRGQLGFGSRRPPGGRGRGTDGGVPEKPRHHPERLGFGLSTDYGLTGGGGGAPGEPDRDFGKGLMVSHPAPRIPTWRGEL